MLAGVVTQDNHLIGDAGRPIAAFARRAGIPFHAVPAPGKPALQAPHSHIVVNAYHGRSNSGSTALQRRRHQEPAKLSRWRRARSLGRDKLEPPNWIKGAIGNGPYQQLTV